MIINAKTRQLIEHALKEDIGTGDITTSSVIAKTQAGKFIILSNEPCLVCGMALAEACFTIVDKDVRFRPLVNDGAIIPKGKVIAHIQGRCYGILVAERTALNFLSWLSGISTLTNRFVNTVKNYKAQIMDTRKTIPTLRYLQRYAVRLGGGKNHRMGLYDQILIKDNHLSTITKKPSAVKEALEKARKYGPKNKKIEIEVKSLNEFKKALDLNPDIIMLDNMRIADIKEAVRLRDSYRIKQQSMSGDTLQHKKDTYFIENLFVQQSVPICLLEASGNVNLDNVTEIAQTGVDRISVGMLTHSPSAIDFSLKAE